MVWLSGISGILFATVTAMFCQLASNSRGAIGYSFAVLGFSYLLQMSGASIDTLTYVSPLGIIMKSQVYVNNYLWPTFVLLILSIIILFISFFLNQLRDLGEGMIPAKPGKSKASKSLLSPIGLSIRLLKNMFIAWAIGLVLLGMSYGSVLADAESFLLSSDIFAQAGITNAEQFITMLMSVMSIVAAIPAVMILLKVRSEEKKGLNEHIISKRVSRTKLLFGYFTLSLISSISMILFLVLGLWSAAFAVMPDDPVSFVELLKSGMVYLPAIWVMIGIATILLAFLPHRTSIVWIYLGYSVFAVYLGMLLGLPDWVKKLTPFGHIPQIPTEEMNWNNLIVLSFIFLVLTIIGFIQYRKRDMVYN